MGLALASDDAGFGYAVGIQGSVGLHGAVNAAEGGVGASNSPSSTTAKVVNG